ncbi:MAG: hypothetical protein LUH10_12240 [Tannerellaceae bacterium]|nr:hypothetical protein [Tannerellaceae bacterium]
MEHIYLDFLVGRLKNKYREIEDISLFNGKLGLVLFLYSLYEKDIVENKILKSIADNVLMEILPLHRKDNEISLTTGPLALAWVLELLLKKKVIKADMDKFFSELDDRLLKYIECYPVMMFDEIIPLSPTCYFLVRTPRVESEAHYKRLLAFICLVDECYNLTINHYYKKIGYDNLPLSYRIGIYHFLIQLQNKGLISVKMDKIMDTILASMPALEDDLTDSIVAGILGFYGYKGADKNKITSKNFVCILSKAGWLSLIYNNPVIFQEVYRKIEQIVPALETRIEDTAKFSDLSFDFNKLLGIGFGLCMQ